MVSRIEQVVVSSLALVGIAQMFAYKVLSCLLFPFIGAVWLSCASLLVVDFFKRRKARGTGRAAIRLLAAGLCSAVVFSLAYKASFRVADKFDLWRARSSTAEALAVAASDCPEVGYFERGHMKYLIDCGPPVRLAFYRGGGLLDNWPAIVYDPSEQVANLVPSARADLATQQELRKLFGGDITFCKRLEGSYFACWFT